jgi:hypothetical protein
MLKIISTLPDQKNFKPIQNKGERFQWVDRYCDHLRILSHDSDPWGKEWTILLLLEQGKRRDDTTYPKRLNLLCLPIEEGIVKAKIVRERWTGNFAHSCEPTLLHFDFPIIKEESINWLMLSIVKV